MWMWTFWFQWYLRADTCPVWTIMLGLPGHREVEPLKHRIRHWRKSQNKCKTHPACSETTCPPAVCVRCAEEVTDGSQYFVLLMITDGVISDMAQTKEAVVNVSSYNAARWHRRCTLTPTLHVDILQPQLLYNRFYICKQWNAPCRQVNVPLALWLYFSDLEYPVLIYSLWLRLIWLS